MDAIDLAGLDDVRPLDLDPSLWPANLTALRDQQPELAEQLQHASLPAHWRPVAGLDDCPTYRVESAGEAPRWLADTAAPQRRAAALLRYDQISDQNPALPTIAAGAELKLLLEKLTPQQAVFVFEEDLTQLAAVLRTTDLAQGITTGRCILVPPQHAQAFLERLLEQFPGLGPPGTIVTLPGVSGGRLEQVRAICERVTGKATEARSRQLQSLAAHMRTEASTQGPQPRLALVALGPSPRSHQLSSELAAAANGLRWTTCRCAATGPREAHLLPHCEQLAHFAAELSICIDHSPGLLPLPTGKTVCRWHPHAKDVPEALADDDTVHLAATPRIAEALRAAGVPDRRLVDFYWAMPSTQSRIDPRPRVSRTIVIVADLPDASAAACRIEQPTHKRLWTQLHQRAAKVWQTAEITQPATLLRNAERTSGIELADSSLRRQMVRIIEHVLIPAIVLERILQPLLRESFEIVTVGTGWHRCSSLPLQSLAEDLDGRTACATKTAPLAAIFAGPLDPLSPALLHAAALGWPLLIHSPGRASLTPRLGGILQPQQHYEPFAGSRDLRAALDAVRADPPPVAARCARTRTHLQQCHGYGQRLTSLVRRLGLEWPGTET